MPGIFNYEAAYRELSDRLLALVLNEAGREEAYAAYNDADSVRTALIARTKKETYAYITTQMSYILLDNPTTQDGDQTQDGGNGTHTPATQDGGN